MLTEIWIEIQSFNVFLQGRDNFFFLIFFTSHDFSNYDKFDQFKLEKKHKKAVAREEEYAKVNVESTARCVHALLSAPREANLPEEISQSSEHNLIRPSLFYFSRITSRLLSKEINMKV